MEAPIAVSDEKFVVFSASQELFGAEQAKANYEEEMHQAQATVLMHQAALTTILTYFLVNPIDPNVHDVLTQEWMSTSNVLEAADYSPLQASSSQAREHSRTPPTR